MTIDRIIYFDLSKDGTKTSTNDVELKSNESAVLESVENIILTEPKTKIYKGREFGCGLSQFLFDPIDNSTALRIFDRIELSLEKYETRMKDLYIEVIPLIDENTFKINISFKMDESERELKLETTLEKLR